MSGLPVTKTDNAKVMNDVARVPAISAEQLQHVGRYSGAVVLSVFEMIGGAPRMAAWAETNPTDFFTKLFPKIISRQQQVDVSGNLTIDDAISKLERMDNETIDAEYTEVTPRFYDL